MRSPGERREADRARRRPRRGSADRRADTVAGPAGARPCHSRWAGPAEPCSYMTGKLKGYTPY